jgi:3-methyladenine DNA glycosylase AlkD
MPKINNKTATELIDHLNKLADPKRAKALSWFFKTGPGQYGEGDKFIGITVPELRRVAKDFKELPFVELATLLRSSVHEHRFIALKILVLQYERGDAKKKEEVCRFYLKNIKSINNWDLVDTSAPYILGEYLLNKDKKILYKLVRSKNIWERRISIISTFMLIREGKYNDSLKLAEILLKDKHDLIHKAVGWMLREIGKRSPETEHAFLEKYCGIMPRTMLRYAIEKFPPEKRREYLNRPRTI